MRKVALVVLVLMMVSFSALAEDYVAFTPERVNSMMLTSDQWMSKLEMEGTLAVLLLMDAENAGLHEDMSMLEGSVYVAEAEDHMLVSGYAKEESIVLIFYSPEERSALYSTVEGKTAGILEGSLKDSYKKYDKIEDSVIRFVEENVVSQLSGD